MAFHSYTRLIRKLFNAYRCGPPSRVTGTSSWPSVDHPVSRLPPPTRALFRLAFTADACLMTLVPPATATRRFIMQKARRHIFNMLRPLVGAGFQDLFHSPTGVLFTFPSRYWYAIGLTGVFSLAGWSRRIRAGFLVSRVTQGSATPPHASLTGLSPSPARLSRRFRSRSAYDVAALLPPGGRDLPGLGSSPVARHYWGNH